MTALGGGRDEYLDGMFRHAFRYRSAPGSLGLGGAPELAAAGPLNSQTNRGITKGERVAVAPERPQKRK